MPDNASNTWNARILLVDDTKANLDLLCELLEAEGYNIAMAPNGEIALKVASRAVPDLILLDVKMPGIDGFEVCRRLKADPQTRDIPVIFITAEDLTESVVTGFEVGGIDYIKKPFQEKEVLARVDTHLQIDHLTRELAQRNAELERANQQIEESADRKSAFLASMSHEIRTPITAIKGFVDNILDGIGGEPNDSHRRYLDRVVQNTDHLLNLVNDILDLSKIEADRMDVSVDKVDAKDLISSCCESIRPSVAEGVQLDQEINQCLGDIQTDQARLRQILLNLLSNAAKFTEVGRITVRAEQIQDDDSVPLLSVSVSDTGIGIPNDQLEAIFDEFRQVKNSDRQHKGTGLGLSITKRLCELLGGAIVVESELGKGSCFVASVPLEAS